MGKSIQKEDELSFVPPYKGGYFRGRYVSKEDIEDMFNWFSDSIPEEYKKEIYDKINDNQKTNENA